MIFDNELVVDNFAGGGGASEGMQLGLGRHVDIAINHDPEAIAMHKMNHPEAEHYCESVWDVDPVDACKGRPVGLGWFSPDCKHFSKAKGSKPVDKNIRGLAWIVSKWAASVSMRIFMLENVEEFMTWGPLMDTPDGPKADPDKKGQTFEAFVKILTTGLDKDHEVWGEIREALGEDFPHYDKLAKGLGYEIEWRTLKACDYGAPTIRKRFFMIGRRDGLPIMWPEPTHGDPKGYLVQSGKLLPWKTAADIIDWSIPVKSIFNRKRPLAEKTMARIAKGIERYIVNADSPFVVPEEFQVPFITECANGSSQRNMSADEPLRTICAQVKGGHFALVTSFISKFRGTNVGHGVDEPCHTISAGGLHLGEVRAFLLKYYGTSSAVSMDEPLHTVTTKERFGLITIRGDQYQIVDIGLRMLDPRELFLAQGFDSSYKISHDSEGNKLTKKSQVARCGNAVCPPMAKALVIANLGPDYISSLAA